PSAATATQGTPATAAPIPDETSPSALRSWPPMRRGSPPSSSLLYIPGMATSLTWLGHAAFRVDSPGRKRIYVDPFLSGNPRTPDSERQPERCDLVVLTHGHGDHVGDTIALHKQFGCPVVAQVELRGWLTQNGVADDGQAH